MASGGAGSGGAAMASGGADPGTGGQSAGGRGGSGASGSGGRGGEGGRPAGPSAPVWSETFVGCVTHVGCLGPGIPALPSCLPDSEPWPPGTGARPAPPTVFADLSANLSGSLFGADLPGWSALITFSAEGAPFGVLRLTSGAGAYVPLVPPPLGSGTSVTVAATESMTPFEGALVIPSALTFTQVPLRLVLTTQAVPAGAEPQTLTGAADGPLRWVADADSNVDAGYVELELKAVFMPDMHGYDARTFCRVPASSGELAFDPDPLFRRGPYTSWQATLSRVTARPAAPPAAGVTLFARRPLARLAQQTP